MVFFFKQKTAYEIGLGIPAEPLFRSVPSIGNSFFMVLIKLLPILGTISGKTVKLMVLALICLGNNQIGRASCRERVYSPVGGRNSNESKIGRSSERESIEEIGVVRIK